MRDSSRGPPGVRRLVSSISARSARINTRKFCVWTHRALSTSFRTIPRGSTAPTSRSTADYWARRSFARRIVSYDFATGEMQVLAHDDAWHQPNDLCQTPTGDIFFTDPDFEPGRTSGVYRLSHSRVTKVISDMPKPNGIIASNDGRTLYVSDSRAKHWKAFEIAPDGTIGTGRIFFDPDTPNRDSPDGMSIDEHGNLYFAGRGGVWVVAPDGQSKGLIVVPEFCSNVTFGGPDGRTFYLTCSKKVYSLPMRVRGGQLAK